DVDDRQVGQAHGERLLRLRALGVADGFEAVACEGVAQVRADGGFVLDDGDAAAHRGNVAQRRGRPAAGRSRRCAARSLPESCPQGSGSRLRGIPTLLLPLVDGGCAGQGARAAPIASGRIMAREPACESLPIHPDAPNFDWREWLSFVGSVLGTALVVSVVLGGIVLLLA